MFNNKALTGVIAGTAADVLDSPRKGWVVGNFMDGLAKTENVEVKLWRYDSPFEYGVKIFHGPEFIAVFGGDLRIHIVGDDGQEQEWQIIGARPEFILIPPGLKRRVTCAAYPTFGVTVRWPSRPDAQTIVKETV
jgi:hypothetical protein